MDAMLSGALGVCQLALQLAQRCSGLPLETAYQARKAQTLHFVLPSCNTQTST